MVQNSFQRAKGNLGNRHHNAEAKGQGCSIMKMRIDKTFSGRERESGEQAVQHGSGLPWSCMMVKLGSMLNVFLSAKEDVDVS